MTQATMTQATTLPSTFEAAKIFFLSYSTMPDGTQQIEWLGSIMIWLLIAMSILSVGLIANALLSHRKHVIIPHAVAEAFLRACTSGSPREARAIAAADNSDFSRMAVAALDTLPLGRTGAVDAAEQAAQECAARRFRTIEILNVLAQISPMIGLFGTVYGMIVAFQTVAATGGQADPALLAGGIGTALVTTFWGLVVAIPALLTYATVRNWIDALIAEALEITLRATAASAALGAQQ